jgi:Flp pilus assembly protein CpaB
MEITRHRGVPGGRAVLGGVLVALAVVGVFVAYGRASRSPTDPVVVAAREIRTGEVLDAADLRVVDGDLPSGTGATAFSSVDELAGHVALGPIGDGEIVQAGSVTADAAEAGLHEVALTLPRRQVAVGRLKVGERVDVFVTYEERTSSVVRGAEVVLISADDDASLTSERDVSLVIAVPSGDAVAAVVHALRTGDVTVVRSTFADATAEEPISYAGAGSTTTTVDAAGA